MKNPLIIIFFATLVVACDSSSTSMLSAYISQVKSRPMLSPKPLLSLQELSFFYYTEEMLNNSPFFTKFNKINLKKNSIDYSNIIGYIKDEKKIFAFVKKDKINLDSFLIKIKK